MGMTVTLDRMIHTIATHDGLGKELDLGECANAGGDLSPIDVLAMSLASCVLLVMAKAARAKAIDLTGAWAAVSDDVKEYKIKSITVTIHSPQSPSETDRSFLEKESHACPVYLAVQDNINVNLTFAWGSEAARLANCRPAPQAAACAQTTN
jgi:uncharacterized OsmC-like protein